MSVMLGPGLPIDVDRLVSTRLLVNASSGAGKSWCLRRLLEQTHGLPEDAQHLSDLVAHLMTP